MKRAELSEVQYRKKVPKLGSEMCIDFINVTSIDLKQKDQIDQVLKEILADLEIKPLLEQTVQYEQENGISQIVMFQHGHVALHANYQEKTLSIDYFNSQYHTYDEKLVGVKKIETYLHQKFGLQNIRQCVVVPRGQTTRVYFHDASLSSEIMQKVEFVQREQTKYNDIRVYDSQNEGTIVLLKNKLVMCKDLKKHYKVDVAKEVIKTDVHYKNILILGGADLEIAGNLLETYPNIENVTVVEIDEMLGYVAKKYYKTAEKAGNDQRLTQINKCPIYYLQQLQKNGQTVDGIFVDLFDSWCQENIPQNLQQSEFYQLLCKSVGKNGFVSQLIGREDNSTGIISLLQQQNQNSVKITKSKTDFYGEDLKILTINIQ